MRFECRQQNLAANVSTYFKKDCYDMTDEEILKVVARIEGLGGMTVNERLYVSGLLDEFDKVMKTDKAKARRILELLQVDKSSIDKIVL